MTYLRGAGQHLAEGGGELATALLERRKVLLDEKLAGLKRHNAVLLIGEGAELGEDRVEEAHVLKEGRGGEWRRKGGVC